MTETVSLSLLVPVESKGRRLDIFLAAQLPELSRSSLTRLIKEGHILVNNREKKAGYRVAPGDTIAVSLPPPKPVDLIPIPLDFPILFEDDSLLVLIKPPGLVVHPAPGNYDKTLVHGLLHHCGKLPASEWMRPGIVHRLDKDTSGVMVVAKTEKSMALLARSFQQRAVKKKYQAILKSTPVAASSRIDKPIGRHPVQRKKMTVDTARGRHAVTEYRVLEELSSATCLVDIVIETGRTHQIRVHMASIGCPVLGDTLYGGKSDVADRFRAGRQMLHATTLAFRHPLTGGPLSFTVPLWDDVQICLQRLRIGSVDMRLR